MRVPSYTSVIVTAAGVLTSAAWDGAAGGVLALRATGAVIIDGQITMDSAGLRGGARPVSGYAWGNAGEGIDAGMGGSGGRGECFPLNYGIAGGGGSHAGSGTVPAAGPSCTPAVAKSYGVADFQRLYLGSGGGSGGNDNHIDDNPTGGAGGRGGGLVYLSAASIEVGPAGVVSARGGAGQGDTSVGSCTGTSTVDCWDFAGAGGGGSGGSIFLWADSLDLTGTVSASGGTGGIGQKPQTTGGDGGSGIVVRLDRASASGSSVPIATLADEVPLYGPDGVLTSANLTAGESVSALVAFQYDLVLEPGTSAALQLSDDGTSWTDAAGNDGIAIPMEHGQHSISLESLPFGGALFYRVLLRGTSSTSPRLLDVTLTYE
jgi:hypothetical protein